MKKTKLLIIALLTTIVSFAQQGRSSMSLVRHKDTTERRLILNLSELEVAQLQAQLDNAGYLTDKSDLPHQKAKAIIDVCQQLQEKIEDAKRQQWPKVIPKAAADTSLSKPKK